MSLRGSIQVKFLTESLIPKSNQQTLVEQIASETMSPFLARVLRISKMMGLTEEKEVTKMCLLKQKDARAILKRLITKGYVQTQEIPGTVQGRKLALYGVNYRQVESSTAQRVMKAIFNLKLVKEGNWAGCRGSLKS